MSRRYLKKPLLNDLKKYLIIGIFSISFLWPFLPHFLRSPTSTSPHFYSPPFSSKTTGYVNGLITSLEIDKVGASVSVSRGDHQLKFDTPLLNPSLKRNDKEVVYSVPQKSIELKYTLIPQGLKEDIILHKIPEIPLITSSLSVQNLVVKLSPEGLPVFYDKNGQYQFHIQPPFAHDAAGATSYGLKYKLLNRSKDNISNPHIKEIRPGKSSQSLLGGNQAINETVYTIALEIDEAWLHDPKRVLPITIDPTVVHDTQSEFATGSLNRVKDAGVGSTDPSLTSYYQELTADQYTLGLWHLNGSNGSTLPDSSGNNNDATLGPGSSAPAMNVRGLFDYGAYFDGTSDYISLPNSVVNREEITVEAWVNLNDSSGWRKIFSHGNDGSDGWGIDIGVSNSYIVARAVTTNPSAVGYSIYSSASCPLYTWQHVAFTFKSGEMALYVNGQLIGTATTGSTLRGTNNNYIGASNLGGIGIGNFWSGQIDEFRISNIARTPEEIKADASRRSSSTYTSAVLDLTNAALWNSLSWTETGVATGNGETLSSGSSLVAQWNFNQSVGGTSLPDAGSCVSCGTSLVGFANLTAADALPLSGWTSQNQRWGSGALMFDGTDDYISVPDIAALNPTIITLETWFKPKSFTTYQNIIDKRNAADTAVNYLLQVLPTSGIVQFSSRPTKFDLLSATPLEVGKWHHIVATFDGATAKIYINGKLNSSMAYAGSLSTTNDNPLRLCRQGVSATNYCDGILDSTRIYSRALTANEILSNYQAGNIELQTRAGNSSNPNDGTWEAWKPDTLETSIASFDSEATNWSTTSHLLTKANDSTVKVEGSGSLKLSTNAYLNPASTNLASARPYTFNTAPHSSYPDTNYNELTNGTLTTGWSDGNSIGFYNGDSSVIIDLGSTQNVSEVAVQYGSGTDSQVYFPRSAIVSTSLDNITFTNSESLSCPNDTTSESSAWCYDNFSQVVARYIKITVTQAFTGQWTMWGEARVAQGDLFTAGLWHLDETNTAVGSSFYDASNNNNHGIATTIPSVSQGINNKARTFNGASSYIKISDAASLDIASAITLQAWIKPNSVTGLHTIVGKRDVSLAEYNYGFRTNGDELELYYFGSSVTNVAATTNANLVTGQWYHVAVTYDATGATFYVNGIPQDKTCTAGICTGPLTTDNNSVGIGRPGDFDSQYFDGAIDEVRISNIVRSPEEISENCRLNKDHYLNKVISSTDLSNKTSLPFYIAADRPGNYLTATVGESPFANYQPDSNTVGLWHLDESNNTILDSSDNNLVTAFATGGNITTFGNYTIHKFRSSGTFNVLGNRNMDVLVVAGGGGAGSNGGGGGGAGGVVYSSATFVGTGANTITVGGGGGSNANGGNSAFGGTTATGGGAGGSRDSDFNGHNGGSGGGGGGAGSNTSGGTGTAGQGSNGGTGYGGGGNAGPGGGGGCGGAGSPGGNTVGGNGGIGCANSITGISTYYGGGGGGGLVWGFSGTPGTGGLGGGGNGVNPGSTGGNGTSNTGGGGGGNNGSGGSGIVIARYLPYLGTSQAGKIGRARKFDGTNDYIPIANNPAFDLGTGDFTFSFWTKHNATPNYHTYLEMGLYTAGVLIRQDSASVLNVYIQYTGAPDVYSYAFTPTIGQWYYITLTRQSGVLKLYINGQQSGSNATSTQNIQVSSPLYLGHSAHATNSQYLNGYLDEVRIDKVARSPEEIRQAFEVGTRSHEITIDFGAKLVNSNLVIGSTDYSFNIDATPYGLGSSGAALYLGDKIIIKENIGGTEYIAQGTVSSVNQSTGAVIVNSWDSGSTFPAGGYTINAVVFKWQKESWNITEPLDSHLNAITNLSFRVTGSNEGRTIWLDDLKSNSNYLTLSAGSTITSSVPNRYFQYRTIFNSFDEAVSPSLSSVTMDYLTNAPPLAPILVSNYLHDNLKSNSSTPQIRFSTTDQENDNLQYQIQWDTDASFGTGSSATSGLSVGFSNVTTVGNTSPFISGNTISYTFQSPLSNNSTYFYHVRARDPNGSNLWSSWSTTRSLTIDTSLFHPAWFQTHADQFATNTNSTGLLISDANNEISVAPFAPLDTGDTASNWVSSDPTNTTVSQETTIKQEGTGSVKVQTGVGTTYIDLMEFSSDANAQLAYVSNGAMSAIGGTTFSDGTYNFHTFKGNGNFVVSNIDSGLVDALVVGGGGGGANGTGGGGGGGGRVVSNTNFSISINTYNVGVGGGGGAGAAGGTSTFSSLSAVGGNGGVTGTGGSSGSGYAGGGSWVCCTDTYQSGGGGGDSGAGIAGTTSSGGGPGTTSSLSGSPVCYGGGGGGGRTDPGTSSGQCGGGTGGGSLRNGNVAAGAGTANTGGGGGGSSGYLSGGSGGSGIVIIRYLVSPYLQAYSEASIKTQGSYALKGVATTSSLNKSLVRTLSTPVNLSNRDTLHFDIRSTRTGSNLKISLHDSGGTTTEVTPNITNANTYQSISFDISNVSNANKDAIDQITITVVNATANNTFYLDNMYATQNTSLDDTITRTLSSTDISTPSIITFWVRSTVAGTIAQIEMGETTSNEQSYAFSIGSTNTWEQKIWNISSIPPTARNAITKVAFRIIGNTYSGVLYFDNIVVGESTITSSLSTPITAANITSVASDSRWFRFNFNDNKGSGNVLYQILYDLSGTPTLIPDSILPGNSAGFSTSNLDLTDIAISSYPTLYLKANLYTAGSPPSLQDWGISINSPPASPTAVSPANSATNQPLTPTVFKIVTTDADNDYVQYKISFCIDPNMTFGCQTFDQTTSSVGWSGMNVGTSAFSSGTTATYTYTGSLTPGATYYWKAYALDPSGTNVWSNQTTPFSFSVANLTMPLNCLVEESTDEQSLKLKWVDTSSIETGYTVERKVDGGSFANLVNLGAGVTGYLDSTTSSGHTYQYRVTPTLSGPIYGQWCETATLNLTFPLPLPPNRNSLLLF